MTKLGDREYFYLFYGMFTVSCAYLTTSILGFVPNIPTFAFLTVFLGAYAYYFYRRIHQEKELENNEQTKQL